MAEEESNLDGAGNGRPSSECRVATFRVYERRRGGRHVGASDRVSADPNPHPGCYVGVSLRMGEEREAPVRLSHPLERRTAPPRGSLHRIAIDPDPPALPELTLLCLLVPAVVQSAEPLLVVRLVLEQRRVALVRDDAWRRTTDPLTAQEPVRARTAETVLRRMRRSCPKVSFRA